MDVRDARWLRPLEWQTTLNLSRTSTACGDELRTLIRVENGRIVRLSERADVRE